MKKRGDENRYIRISLPQPSSADLRGKQSVRATFKLTERAINAMSTISVHLGIKQKSLFDHLVEDTGILDLIARDVDSEEFNATPRVQKTYVLSRKTLSTLENISKRFNAHRDVLVEYSIQRLMPVIEREREKHRKHKELFDEMKDYLAKGDELLRKSKELLDEDDPVYYRIEQMLEACSCACDDVETLIERGRAIEEEY